ncbi:MAG: sigma-70 family RNA polymerase sigma factor [Gracilibacteraceae bacterium]|jgi:RNA polymerase sigma-70 factor (ECF subfamily)|nr:sigma-70 family RNA polymerase sigma factor [Gracilibacteraceae bacterium]
MKSESEARRAVELYADTVRRVCFLHMKNHSDVEDVFQDVFLKYVLRIAPFDSYEHEKAWLIRVAVNACKDVHKSFFRRKGLSLEELDSEPSYDMPEDSRAILDAVLALPEKYRDVIYLFYYEGYSAVEIAGLLGKNENTIYTWLSRAKGKLKDALGGDFADE